MAVRFDKSIFVHIPKCGGSSIGKLYGKQIVGPKAHFTIEELEEQESNVDEYIVNVRNPYNRFHSWYHYCIEWDQKRIDGEIRTKKGESVLFYIARMEKLKLMGFDGFVKCLPDEEMRECLHEHYKIGHPFELQTRWFENQTDKPVKLFKLEEGGIFPYLKELGYDKHPIVEKKSKLKTEYSQEQKDIVYEYFKHDFERLNYER